MHRNAIELHINFTCFYIKNLFALAFIELLQTLQKIIMPFQVQVLWRNVLSMPQVPQWILCHRISRKWRRWQLQCYQRKWASTSLEHWFSRVQMYTMWKSFNNWGGNCPNCSWLQPLVFRCTMDSIVMF